MSGRISYFGVKKTSEWLLSTGTRSRSPEISTTVSAYCDQQNWPQNCLTFSSTRSPADSTWFAEEELGVFRKCSFKVHLYAGKIREFFPLERGRVKHAPPPWLVSGLACCKKKKKNFLWVALPLIEACILRFWLVETRWDEVWWTY